MSLSQCLRNYFLVYNFLGGKFLNKFKKQTKYLAPDTKTKKDTIREESLRTEEEIIYK
jgi:hypothetical protein